MREETTRACKQPKSELTAVNNALWTVFTYPELTPLQFSKMISNVMIFSVKKKLLLILEHAFTC